MAKNLKCPILKKNSTVGQWHVQEGDSISAGESYCDVSSIYEHCFLAVRRFPCFVCAGTGKNTRICLYVSGTGIHIIYMVYIYTMYILSNSLRWKKKSSKKKM